MVELVKISKFELPTVIKIAYEGDDDLLDKYHVDKYDIMGAVASTLHMIHKTVEWEDMEMDYFKVMYNETPIGYICTYPNNLYSFGINKEYRTKEILIDWWGKVVQQLGEGFITMLYPNNTRAINFLKKQGMKLVDDVEENCTTLIYIKETKFSQN